MYTGTSNYIELGELLCDSLDEASESNLLKFAISSEEVGEGGVCPFLWYLATTHNCFPFEGTTRNYS